MTSRNKSSNPKDIDDVLSSIDSLLDTASDVEMDDLPVLEIEPEPATDQPAKAKQPAPEEITAGKIQPSKKKKTVAKKTATSKKAEQGGNKTPGPAKTRSRAKTSNRVNSKINTGSKDEPTNTKAKQSVPESENNQDDQTQNQSKSRPGVSTDYTGFTTAQQALPVLDQVITEEEIALIAQGGQPPRRVITEKFVPRTLTDKIIELLKIHLSDHDITRLEYEYLHELIGQLLEQEKNKPG